jgi:acyl-CoA ligase (AMP-forming) (exosortase A-associated)
MTDLVHELITHRSRQTPAAHALSFKNDAWNYARLATQVSATAQGLLRLGLARGERVAIYLPKRPETVCGIFGAAQAGGTFVPVNPLLKPEQVAHILRDCNVRVLVTSSDRAQTLASVLESCHDLHTVVLIDRAESTAPLPRVQCIAWDELLDPAGCGPVHRVVDADMTAILYTSGSTGRPKGVVLSHRNLVSGAKSVAQYLDNRPEDRLLAVLPLSFDYGLSQLTTAFHSGAGVVLMDYLLPRDVINLAASERITGIAAVPPLWIQLAQLPWPEEARQSLRYLTSSGGVMPRAAIDALRRQLPNTRVFLMYGLTEAFRSTYLPPEEIDRRPESIGKAIPNAEVMVVREDGTPCAPGEPGELVHRGSLVALGYWNDPEKTAERFRPAPGRPRELTTPEIAVWSGDTVRTDEDGFLYFINRRDEMIKTSGYRVSPTEIEEVIYATGLVGHVAALGVPHPVLGQVVAAVVTPREGTAHANVDALLEECRNRLPTYMVPAHVRVLDVLPRNPNGKIDRKALSDTMQHLFTGTQP